MSERLFLDTNTKPYSNEQLTQDVSCAFKGYLEDEEIYFDVLFYSIKERLNENAFYAIDRNFSSCDLFAYNSLSIEKQKMLLDKISATSFRVEFDDGIVVHCESFVQFFNNLLRKDFEKTEITDLIEKINESTDEVKHIHKFRDEITTPQEYADFMSKTRLVKVINSQIEMTNAAYVVGELKRSLNKFVFNIKSCMESEYKNQVMKKVDASDLSGYMSMLVEKVKENQHLC